MKWPKRVVLVRHGESEGNVRSPDDISFDDKANHEFALTEKGKQQARLTGKYVRAKYGEFDSYFCSTFRRTQETLSLLCPESVPVIDSRLNELWRGIWHTMSKEKVLTLYPEEASIREREGEYHYRPPGGQSCQDVEVMIHSFIHCLRADYVNKNVLISAHGNWMLLFWRIMLNRQPSEFESRYKGNKYKNCALAIYERVGESLCLVGDNVTSFWPTARRASVRRAERIYRGKTNGRHFVPPTDSSVKNRKV
ncbi:hypothetical protein A2926_00635 [Candidatus Giovannonibacteria bacterium RIFCSPLOWO2_01_FULL_44_40]|uniref:phosphoglycerate mutase (2,3-diphosphoglycerate-dependent) n=1 Tax=Candidatus Giovannonibacteria bacterium RIFCSPHIGHO2_01_FULL_45_23 TaxID=1798325 RepID=A0A1F5VI55_9BACT|nr:MAG: hypothetical protein A2834_04340 [Candidatus Giovannonibacteria bacterium RIFCSPHIGHO2_01_FULL_45_23]OGF75858.1 MAG: hypothetical protein A3C77_02820 [Candidatus Giovannonibacteria bacterium RIFCSPHIGHO2_02_FULL_45_13]OGF80165.1 MAG: hypothetical protein A2926_00635 [Candidatus Giovannonibacteria bacterium RIFCSPLOWO2_01_FULL_44_40]